MAGRLQGLLRSQRFLMCLQALRRKSKFVSAWLRQHNLSARDDLPLIQIRFVYLAVCFLHLIPFKITKTSGGSWELKQLTGFRKLFVILLHFCMTLRAVYGIRVLLRDDLRISVRGEFTIDTCLIIVVGLIGGGVIMEVLVLYAEGRLATDVFNFGNQISQDIAG